MRRMLTVLVLSVAVLSCSGGGGGDAPTATTQTTQIGGVVVAPSGMIAKAGPPNLFQWFASLLGFPDEAIAQVQSLSPAQNARVFLINVDSAGRPIGPPLAVSTTNSDGFFVLNVPPGTNLSPTASTLTVIQAALSNAPGPVPIGSAGVLNVPAVQLLMLVDPGGELGTRRIIGAGASRFSASAAAGYIGLIQTHLDQLPSKPSGPIENMITQMQNNSVFSQEVLPALLDIEQSAQVDQSLLAGTYSVFEYHTYADSADTPFHRTTEHGDLTFDPITGTVTVDSNEFGGILKECINICSRTFTLQSFQDRSFGDGVYFRTATNRVIFSSPGGFSFAVHMNPTGTVGIFTEKSSDGELSVGMLVKQGTNISGADFAATFNFVDFGSILNQSNVNQPVVVGSPWTGILSSRSGAGTVTFNAANSPSVVIGQTGSESTVSQLVSCTQGGGTGCTLDVRLTTSSTGPLNVALPFTIVPNGLLGLKGKAGLGGMSSDKALYAATQTDPLQPADISFSVVVRQSTSGMTNASLNGTYRVITLEDELLAATQVSTRLLTGTARFDGVNTAEIKTLAREIDRPEGCAPTCSITTIITELDGGDYIRTYDVTPTGILTFNGMGIPTGGIVSGAVTPDASFFVVQEQSDIFPVSTRSITLGVRVP